MMIELILISSKIKCKSQGKNDVFTQQKSRSKNRTINKKYTFNSIQDWGRG